jgi:hypothetical protein
MHTTICVQMAHELMHQIAHIPAAEGEATAERCTSRSQSLQKVVRRSDAKLFTPLNGAAERCVPKKEFLAIEFIRHRWIDGKESHKGQGKQDQGRYSALHLVDVGVNKKQGKEERKGQEKEIPEQPADGRVGWCGPPACPSGRVAVPRLPVPDGD